MRFTEENFNTGSKMNKSMMFLLAALLVVVLPLGDALGRGFGGFRGGGIGGGGFDRGGFGGFREGGFAGGGLRDRSFDTGGFRDSSAQRFDDFRAGDADRWQSDAYHPQGERSFSGDNWSRREDFDNGRIGDAAGVSRTQLDKFLGMPTDAGLGHVAPAAAGAGIEGTRVTAGAVEGPRGGTAAFASRTNLNYIPQNVAAGQGWLVRNEFNRHNLFTPTWYANHANVWGAAALGASAWAPASWSSASDWVGCDSEPEAYDYGTTVLYQGGNVYVEGQPAGSEAQYYDQASSLAASGDANQDDDANWLPLGVFGMVQDQQTDPTMIFQLAVNRQGVIRGNCYNTVTDTTLPVHGAVDKKTQRAAWTIGDNKSTVIDTGLANLTKDQAPALMHFGKERTQEWLLVRLKNKAQQESGSSG